MQLPKRKRLRLEYYDYSLPGAYFVTICTYNRQNLFVREAGREDVSHKTAVQNEIIHHWLSRLPSKFENIRIDKYVIMNDHIHLILVITDQLAGCKLSDVLRWFKTMTTNQYIRLVKEKKLKSFEIKLWQASYNDHVIRCNDDYENVWKYIENNVYKNEDDNL